MDMSLDIDPEVDFDTLANPTVSFASPDSPTHPDSPRKSTSPKEANTQHSTSNTDRPYHSKRPHKKSRSGCITCKRRKVKCDETRPSCRNCTLRRENCQYPRLPQSANAPSSSSGGSSPTLPSEAMELELRSRVQESPDAINPNGWMVLKEPLYRPGQITDDTDMKMLWFYTTESFTSFAVDSRRSPVVDNVLKVKIVEHAFQSPFLMNTLLALASTHLQQLKQPVNTERAVTYRTNAFAGYREAIEAARPKDFPALLACSLLMCGLSSQMFREPDSKSLYIVDWAIVWRGIGLIADIISPNSIEESGLAVLFYRPSIDLEKSAGYIPNNLLFMITNMKEGEEDFESQQIYYDTLKYLGSLYMELENGFGPILDLRVITWFTFIPKLMIPLAKAQKPRSLIILAYYLCFAKISGDRVWWMGDIADRQILEIASAVGEGWSDLLRLPLTVVEMTKKEHIAKLMLNNFTWETASDLYDKQRDPRVNELCLVDDVGRELVQENGVWKLKGSSLIDYKVKKAAEAIAEQVQSTGQVLGEIISSTSPP